ncbi:MAG: sulfur carrier protein ThiS adenylyltransferase ThiF [Vallitalea sp.]|jgi:sulfur carrier protein ThiS adenylyltransferase|nr:sulfur carrier protein ThiS adenylyltransferase ThiF [Vallitalea sp.]
MTSKQEYEDMMILRHTEDVFNKIKKGKVAIAGLGGLGSNIAVMLARTGVGHLFLIDFDVVDTSNLNRQNYSISHLGMYKTKALKEQIKVINPYIIVESKTVKVTKENISELFNGYDIICEAFDKADNKSMLINGVLQEFKNTKIVSGSGMAGYDSSNKIRTTKPMNNLYLCGDLISEVKIGHSLMAPRVQICAGHQANMIIRLLLGIEEI